MTRRTKRKSTDDFDDIGNDEETEKFVKVEEKPTDFKMADQVYKFFKAYPPSEMDKSNKKYIKRIRNLSVNNTFIVDVAYDDLYDYFYSLPPESDDRRIFGYVMDDIIKNPFAALKILKQGVEFVIQKDIGDNFLEGDKSTELKIDPNNYSVYVSGYGNDVSVSKIDSTYLGRLIRTKVVVLGYDDDVSIKVLSSNWTCEDCGQAFRSKGSNHPKFCPLCDTGTVFTQLYTNQETVDCLAFQIQEPFDKKVVENYFSQTKKIVRMEGKSLINHFKNTIRPGSTIEIIGIVVLSPKRPPLNVDSKTFNMAKTEIRALYIENKNDDRYEYNEQLLNIIDRYVKPNMVSKHVKKIMYSIAPHIYGHVLIKLALLLQLVEGEPVIINGSRIRGSIHILLVGDPGEAKSEFGNTLLKLDPNSIYVQADAATAVGLTTAVMPPDETGSRTIELGALPLANESHVFVEEADKFKNKEDINNLSSALDDRQVIMPRKGGLIAELPNKCGCMFAANPDGGRDWDVTKDIFQQTKFPTWFLSRMDLIFVNKRTRNKKEQKEILEHRIKVLSKSEKETDYLYSRKHEDPFSPTKLLEIQKLLENDDYSGTYSYDYLVNEIHYLKTTYHPVLPEESDAYTKMIDFIINTPPIQIIEKDGSIKYYSLVDNRTINTLCRLALASAKIHRRNIVTMEDAELAIALMQASMSTRIIETPSLSTNDNNQQAFINPKLTNHLIKLLEVTQKSETTSFNTILRALSLRVRHFNRGLVEIATQKCITCNAMGYITDFVKKDKYMCEQCKGTGRFADDFRRHEVTEKIFEDQRNPFSEVKEVNMFFDRYVALGYITHKHDDIYIVESPIINDLKLERDIDKFIREIARIMHEKKIKDEEKRLAQNTGGATISMVDAHTMMKNNNNIEKKI